MNTIVEPIETSRPYGREGQESTGPASPSAVSWGAIFAGAAAAAALSLILLLLGTGLGLSSVSPWANEGVGATTLGVSTILWLTFTQLAASAMGGYLAGRLRTKWLAVHTDEVYFRDTAHGFLAWAVATVGTAALLTSAVTSVVGAGLASRRSRCRRSVGDCCRSGRRRRRVARRGAIRVRRRRTDALFRGFAIPDRPR